MRWINVSWQEWHYFRRLKRRLPSDLIAVFPERMCPVYSRAHGWGVVESLVLNEDGSPIRRVSEELARVSDPLMRSRIYGASVALLSCFVKHAVCFYDPPNLMVQWTGPESFRLRVMDFEPRCKAAIPGLSFIRPFVRLKVLRRGNRYLRTQCQPLFSEEERSLLPQLETTRHFVQRMILSLGALSWLANFFGKKCLGRVPSSAFDTHGAGKSVSAENQQAAI